MANVEPLLNTVTSMGQTFNPPKANMQVAAVNTQYQQAKQQVSNTVMYRTELNNAINARREAFKGLRLLMTRILAILIMCDASAETIADFMFYKRKISGLRAKAIEPVLGEDGQPLPDQPTTHSVSQISYADCIAHFHAVLNILDIQQAHYTPNEADLTMAELNLKLQDLIAKNSTVLQLQTQYKDAQISRNAILFDKPSGLIYVARNIKKYLRNLYGVKSQQYAAVKGLYFPNLLPKK